MEATALPKEFPGDLRGTMALSQAGWGELQAVRVASGECWVESGECWVESGECWGEFGECWGEFEEKTGESEGKMGARSTAFHRSVVPGD